MKLSYTIFFLLLSFNIFAQKDEQDIITPFFKIFKEDPKEALDFLYQHHIDKATVAPRQRAALQEELTHYAKLGGQFLEAEYLIEASAGNDFSNMVYLLKYEQFPIRLSFVFYRPKEDWKLYKLSLSSSETVYKDLIEATKSAYLLDQ